MKLPKFYFTNKLFVTIFISYFLLMFITVVLGSVIYLVTASTVNESTENYNQAILQQTRTIFDEKLMSVERLALEIAFNSYAVKTAYSTSVDDSESLYTISKLIEILRTSKDANDFIKSIYIYFSNSDSVVSNEGKYDPNLFYKEIVPLADMSFEQWKSFFKEQSFRGYKPVDTVRYNSYSKEYLTFYHPLSSYKLNKSLGAVAIMIDKEMIDSFIANMVLDNNGAIFILNENNEIILKTGNNEFIEYVNKENINEGFRFFKSKKFGNLVVNCENSKSTELKYVSVVSMSSYYQKASFVKNVTVIITILQLILGILFALILSKRSYTPIRKISYKLLELAGYGSGEKGEVEDHFSFIERFTASTIRENTTIKDSMSKLKPALRVDLINQLFRGTSSGIDEINENLESLGIVFKGNRFAVIKIFIDDCSIFIKNNTLQEMALVKLIIGNIMDEIIQKHFSTFTIDMDNDHLAMLLNIEDNINNDRIMKIAEDGQKFIAEKFYIFTSMGISSIREGINEINICFNEAADALNYKMIKGAGSIINFKETEFVRGNYEYAIQTELHLINSIKTGNIEEVENLLAQIFNRNFGSTDQSINMARCLFFDMIGTVIKVLDELHIQQKEVFNDNFDPLDKLMKCKTVDEMYQNLKEIYYMLCKYINKNKKSHNVELKEKTIEYLGKNYFDNGLSLISVSNSLGLNPTYLSVFFKEQVGETFINYMGRLRIEKSKELLSEAGFSIQDIAEKVGYANSNVFIRTFKKYEGCTPGKYRETLKNDQGAHML